MLKRENKKGQGVFGMSYSTIFSIFIIIFIVAVAFFAIRHFIGLSVCSNIGLFYDDLREEIRDAWASSSGRYEDVFTSNIPKKGLLGSGITHVCFGRLDNTPDSDSQDIYDSLVADPRYDPGTDTFNVFTYPQDKGCGSELGAIEVKCGTANCMATDGNFFCEEVDDDGTISVEMFKRSTDYQITLRPVP